MEQAISDLLQSISSWISSLGVDSIRGKLIGSLIIVVLLWLARLVILRVVFGRVESLSARYWWNKAITYTTVVLGVVLVGSIWIRAVQSIATFLGLLAAGLAIALQSPITDLAGWAFILWRRPFEVGDRIQVGEKIGDAVDIRIFQFSLLEVGNWVDADQNTGRVMHIPNKVVFNEIITNYGQIFDYIWHEIPVLVTFESNWQKAKAILQHIANQRAPAVGPDAEAQFREAKGRFLIMHDSPLDPMVYTSVEASGVLLTMRYLCEFNRRRISEHRVWEDVLQAFAREPDVEFAYPTQRFYNDWVERRGQPPNGDLSDSL